MWIRSIQLKSEEVQLEKMSLRRDAGHDDAERPEVVLSMSEE